MRTPGITKLGKIDEELMKSKFNMYKRKAVQTLVNELQQNKISGMTIEDVKELEREVNCPIDMMVNALSWLTFRGFIDAVESNGKQRYYLVNGASL